MTILKQLIPVARLIERELGEELKNQGHVMTGRLRKSIKVETRLELNAVVLEGSFLRYGAFVDQGVKPSRVPFTPGSGRPKSKYIDGLVRFVLKRRLANNAKKALGIAFAIAFKHKKTGIPTPGSRKFSRTGQRKFFVRNTLTRIQGNVETLVFNAFNQQIDISVQNILDQQNTR